MNCIRAQHQFVAYLHSELSPRHNTALLNHIAECAGCREKLAFERLLQDSLQSLPVPPPRAGFSDRVFAGLPSGQGGGIRRRSWFAGALAAALAFGVTFGVMNFNAPRDSASEVAQIMLSVDEVKWVKLRFNAPRDFDQVTLSLRFPKHMELKGYPGERAISWQTQLQAGVNELNLPVIARKPSVGAIVARIKGQNKHKEFKVYLRAQQVKGNLPPRPNA